MPPLPLQELFVAIRQACSSRSWSSGIELVRADAVIGESDDGDTLVLRVKAPGRTVAPTVTLYIEYEEWDCDCDSSADACEHVAAAIIATRQARKEGKALPTSKKAGGRLRYRLRGEGARVVVERLVVAGDTELPLEGSLSALLAGKQSGPKVEPTKIDLTIDRLLTMKRLSSLPLDTFRSLVPLLSDAEEVFVERERVQVSKQPLLPRGQLVDAPQKKGFVLRVLAPAGLVRLLVPGVALVRHNDALQLRLLQGAALAGRRLEELPSEQRFGPERVALLVGEVLPALREQLDLEIATKRLPSRSRKLTPRALLEVSQRGSALSVLPLLVYGDPPCARIDGGRLVHLRGPLPVRDERAEQRVAERLRRRLDLPLSRRSDFVGPDAVRMAAELRAMEDERPGAVQGQAHRTLYPTRPLQPALSLSLGAFAVRFEADSDDGHTLSADPAAVLRAFARGESLVPLDDGGWAQLPSGWLAQHSHRVADLLAARRDDGELARHAHPVLAQLCRALDHPEPADLDGLRPLLDGFTSLPQAPLPDDLTATLRDYQRRGVDWLGFLRDARLGAVLADDMGLGKTLQTLCVLRGRTLVVCPRSVVHNWKAEIGRFRPSLRAHIYHGPNRKLDDSADVTLTTYAILRRDIEQLSAICWDVAVLDEAQAIKNPDSQVAQAAYRIDAGFRVSLSGTPVENRLLELWSQMHFVNRGLLGGREDFKLRYEQAIGRGEQGAAERLRERIGPFVLRRLKREVATELPPRTDAVMLCALTPDERDTYEAIRLATRKQVVAQLQQGGSVLGALEALLRLRQASCDSALVPGQAARAAEVSSKVERLLSALEEVAAGGHKALVFSQWTSLLDRVEPRLSERGLDSVRLDGSTRDREGVVARFQSNDGPPVMLLSLKAGGTGLNLTAADHVFLLDPWWNPAAEDQAADRAHRIGQDKPVMVYRLVSKDTVEERILQLQEKKRAIADAALGGAHKAAQLTRDDLLALLGD